MHRLLVDNDWFETLQPHGVADTDYEELLRPRASTIFPAFNLIQVRYRVSSDLGHASPHLALVDKSYRSWWLVLLETGMAPQFSFYRQQLDILRSARYGRDFARLLAGRCAAVDLSQLELLITQELPGLYVILGHPPAPVCEDPNILIGIVEVFQSVNREKILRINGQQPLAPEERVGTCTRNRHITPYFLKLSFQGADHSIISSPCEIEVNGTSSSWTVTNIQDVVYLIPDGNVSLAVDQDIFALLRTPGGRLRLIPQSS